MHLVAALVGAHFLPGQADRHIDGRRAENRVVEQFDGRVGEDIVSARPLRFLLADLQGLADFRPREGAHPATAFQHVVKGVRLGNQVLDSGGPFGHGGGEDLAVLPVGDDCGHGLASLLQARRAHGFFNGGGAVDGFAGASRNLRIAARCPAD